MTMIASRVRRGFSYFYCHYGPVWRCWRPICRGAWVGERGTAARSSALHLRYSCTPCTRPTSTWHHPGRGWICRSRSGVARQARRWAAIGGWQFEVAPWRWRWTTGSSFCGSRGAGTRRCPTGTCSWCKSRRGTTNRWRAASYPPDSDL